ncbi:alpha/beta-hydrolase [Dendrothele bispora CBS 962.96]|uniref:Alpha/beta-hydrolase n=1 Tax=Dendrothele bispora (strain CBS 962.96) TaxID=1314807 RepID=A0A4V4HHX2_DENBC|nr:alpha/beta-hydrolase [Dendrothele bispora CBS 962.96]
MSLSPETPYTISIPDSELSILQQKLALTRLPDEIEDAGWDYGVPLSDARRLLARWKDGFDWRKVEKELNEEMPQFTRDIEVEGFGVLNVHYAHKKSSKGKDAIPLLFVHGWPGSFIEARKIIPLLTEPEPSLNVPSFHVVALSLPGFGFSDAPKKKGFIMFQYAEVCNKLMLSLGYDRYGWFFHPLHFYPVLLLVLTEGLILHMGFVGISVTQAGDWGFYITRTIAQFYGGKHCIAWHTNYPDAGGNPPTSPENPDTARTHWFLNKSFGYNVEQSTQPQTIGYSQADSPIGLLAWIYEKLFQWSDHANYIWSDDEILTWISIYWFSKSGPAASARIYYEVQRSGDREATRVCPRNSRPNVPLGWSKFPRDILLYPLELVRTIGNLTFYNCEHKEGGHFPATEVPEVLVKDLRVFFGKVVAEEA